MRPPSAADPGKLRAAQHRSLRTPERGFNFGGLQMAAGTQDIAKQPTLVIWGGPLTPSIKKPMSPEKFLQRKSRFV